MKVFLLFGILIVLAGCVNSTSNSTGKESAEISTASSFDCEKSFQSDWCSANIESASTIKSICNGNIYSDDIIYYVIQLKSESGNICLVDIGLGSQKSTVSGCPNAIQRTLSSVSGPVKSLSCYDSNGLETYVEGTNSDGQVFRALNVR